MNILPKKSWHVRTRKNIDKVRKDEAEAADQEKRKRQRVELAEREARTDFLRKRARSKTSGDLTTPDEIPRELKTSESNRDREEEEKSKQTSWEKRVGITQFLHEKSEEVDRPWYVKSHAERIDKAPAKNSSIDRLDPLVTMNKYFERMKKAGLSNPPSTSSATASKITRPRWPWPARSSSCNCNATISPSGFERIFVC